MFLCLDVGNTHILGGIFKEDKIILRFRHATQLIGTSDQFGIFLITFLQTHHILPHEITTISLCSVVPSCDYTLKHALSRYFPSPLFILQAGVKTGLNIKYKNPNEVGTDRIANAIGAIHAFPNKNIIIIDMGTATTFCAINKQKDYLGGTILAGMRLCMESLKANTAKLAEVDIIEAPSVMGRTTKESIQAGLYYSQLGALREIIRELKDTVFKQEPCVVIGTGGFSQLFKDKKVFDLIMPDLVLQGLFIAGTQNTLI
ncbi:MAG: type III pantothenate kinase [Gammaproteobacteria bacterium]|nr:type III pantothenate kinase [Gammaproteobacteria bacterium]